MISTAEISDVPMLVTFVSFTFLFGHIFFSVPSPENTN